MLLQAGFGACAEEVTKINILVHLHTQIRIKQVSIVVRM
jgi:hypothetical protein